MPSVPSPVFSCSLSGWAIESTKTVNEGISSGAGRYAVTLAVSAVVLPIFAVLDVAIYAVVWPGFSISPSHYLRMIRTILFVVQVPFLVIANLFGGNVLPKVNQSSMFDTWFLLDNETERNLANDKRQILATQYRLGEISHEEYMKW